MKVAIHQPDFMPWFGFFRKIARADLWIVLDHVTNNPRDAAFWGRRVRILVNGTPTWLSVSLKRPSDSGVVGVPINKMEVQDPDGKVAEKCRKTIRMAYAAAPFYRQFSYLVDDYFDSVSGSLLDRNLKFIAQVCELLEIHTPTKLSSSLNQAAKGQALILALIHAVGGDEYVSGVGAGGYQDEGAFAESGIQLTYNRFVHPSYRQLRTATFIEGLSILDMLFLVPRDLVKSWVHTA
jgi:hypothetical protein